MVPRGPLEVGLRRHPLFPTIAHPIEHELPTLDPAIVGSDVALAALGPDLRRPG